MPVSGNEETGVKPIARQSCLDIAGVPIKKRRFIRPPSPPSEEQSASPLENDSSPKEHGSLSQESTPSNASVAASVDPSDACNNSVPEANKNSSDNIMQTNTYNLSRVKTEEQSHRVQNDSFTKFGDENKLVAAEKLNNVVLNSAKNELNVAPNEAPRPDGVEICSQHILEGKCNSEVSNVSGNSFLSLGLKEQHISALECCKNDGSQNHENAGPISLNLSLSKGEGATQCKMDNVMTTDSTDVCANRSNWDLNTTMDAWDGSASDATAGRVTADESKTVSFPSDIKPSICSTGIVGSGITVERQLLENSERRPSFTRKVTESAHELTSEESLCLRLSPSFLSINLSQGPSSSSANNETGFVSNFSLPGGLSSAGIENTVNSTTIKSEPFDGAIKLDSRGAQVNPTAFLDVNAVKRELVGQEALKSLNSAALKPIDPRFIKSEPFHDGKSETIEGTSFIPKQQVLQARDTGGQPPYSTNELLLQGQDSRQLSCSMDEQVREGQGTIAKPTCSTEMSMCGNASDHLEQGMCAVGAHSGEEVPKEGSAQVAAEIVSTTVGHNVNELSASDKVDTAITEESNSVNPKLCELKFTDEVPAGSREIGENSVSDEEKVNLSGDMPEEDSLGSDCESDGNSLSMDIEEVECRVRGEFEDGEVIEPHLHAAAEGQSCEKKDVHLGDSENEKGNDAKLSGDDHHISSHVEEKDSKIEDLKTNEDMIKGCVDTLHDGKTVEDVVKSAAVKEPSTVERPTSGADQEGAIMTIQSESFHASELADYTRGQGSELSSDQAITGVQETLDTTPDHCSGKNGETIDVKKNALPKAEASLSGGDVAKDVRSGINRSRIINLSRPSNSSSPGKTRSVSGKPLPSHRERLPDVPLDGGKLPMRGRDEIYNDSSHRFSRERYRDHFPRNSRLNFIRGRGRISSRMDTLHGDRDSERNFASEFYNASSDFSVPRNKYASAIAEADGESINYNIGPNDAFVGTVRGGRKLLDDETSGFRHLPSRRRSPGGRGGASRGIQMVRRVPRNIVEEGANIIGARHAEKIMRGFPDDGTEQAFTRPQPPYEGLDGHFVQGARNYSFVQRRTLPKIRSKSPIRSRSPGPWPSARRRSPDGFSGPSDLPHRRSPIYRMERMRSPDHPGFPREMVVRRHGSPPYLSRPSDSREMDPGHPRSMISNRGQTGRVLLRNNRRFGINDPQERTDGNEFFGGPMHSGRFHEFVGDGNIEDRRRFSERRGPVRSFKPPFNGTDGVNFHLNPDGGPRQFRFFQEDGSELHQRSSLREREFDGQIKNRPGNAPRRPRGIEEQEGNYRHVGQMMYDDGLDDISRVKRKRF